MRLGFLARLRRNKFVITSKQQKLSYLDQSFRLVLFNVFILKAYSILFSLLSHSPRCRNKALKSRLIPETSQSSNKRRARCPSPRNTDWFPPSLPVCLQTAFSFIQDQPCWKLSCRPRFQPLHPQHGHTAQDCATSIQSDADRR